MNSDKWFVHKSYAKLKHTIKIQLLYGDPTSTTYWTLDIWERYLTYMSQNPNSDYIDSM